MDFYGFYTGKIFDAYKFLGAHVEPIAGVTFRTFAPGAAKIALIGEFTDWEEWAMNRVHDANGHETFGSVMQRRQSRGRCTNTASTSRTAPLWITATLTDSAWSFGQTALPSSVTCPSISFMMKNG